jgi:hypothetical protein
MAIDNPKNDKVKVNFNLRFVMCKFCRGLITTIFLLLYSIHNFIKFSWLKDIFNCDFVVEMKMCQLQWKDLCIVHMPKHMFKFDAFESYKVPLYVKHDFKIMCWIIDLNVNVKHVWHLMQTNNIFKLLVFNLHIGEVSYVTKEVYVATITLVETNYISFLLV